MAAMKDDGTFATLGVVGALAAASLLARRGSRDGETFVVRAAGLGGVPGSQVVLPYPGLFMHVEGQEEPDLIAVPPTDEWRKAAFPRDWGGGVGIDLRAHENQMLENFLLPMEEVAEALNRFGLGHSQKGAYVIVRPQIVMDRWIRIPRLVAARYRDFGQEIGWRFHGQPGRNPRSEEEQRQIAKGIAASLNATILEPTPPSHGYHR
jgi:hypothetical protein